MPWLSFIALTLLIFFVMEGVAWWSHKYIMHGWGWGWHRDHHEPHDKAWERNDLYAVVGSGVAITLFSLGWATGLWWVYAIATGITLYGAMYAFVHDGLVHQRWPFHFMPRNGYAKRLVQAHKLHHAVQTREGAVSFGFIFAPDPKRLNAQLRAMRRARSEAVGPAIGPAEDPVRPTAP